MTRRRGDTTELGDVDEWRMELDGAIVVVARAAEDGAHPFAPAGLGDAWVYAISQSAGPASEASETIVAIRRDGARRIARVRGVSVGVTSERDLVIDRRGVRPDIGTMTTAAGPVTTRVAEGVYLPRALTPGLVWRWRQSLVMPQSTIDVEGLCEALGEVEVAAPAGVFLGVHVRCTTRSRLVAGSTPIELVQVEDNFHARGVGLVRSVTAAANGYGSEKVLLRWTVGGG